MKQIEQAIGDLLLRHNCVIVPTFGGFVAEQLSAKIDYNKGVMIPPRKALLFNKQLISNDGLLINELASRKEVSFDEASNDLSAIVSEWNHRLKKGERIELDRVGILFMDAESNLCFEQDRFFNLLLASFGLDQVHFIAQKEVEEIQAEVISINRTIVEPILVEVEEDSVTIKHLPKTLALASSKENEGETAKIVEIAPKKSKSRVWKYVAAACFLPIAFYSIWIPTRTDVLQSGVISIKDFNPFYTSAEGNYTKTAYSEDITFEKNTEPTLQEQIDGLELPNDVIPYRFTEDTYVYVDISELNSTEVAEVEIQNTASPEEIIPEPIGVPVIQPNSMNFIVGCFGSKVNAENLVNKLKSEGLSAFILDVKGGLHRVSAGASLSDESISEIRTKAQSLGFQGWLLK
ncbi:MAG: SPOR domain-containing protein [Crocinitomicaceae bacterium]|nr:SPOR domain-containing protein [Flavobacteriales bacterium]NQZ36378.1 SPOR domain-containing protein [Crocinitomicaceae bacterium]